MSRTLVVTNDFPPRRGGIETFVRQLCDDLPPEDVVVHTASMPGDQAYDATLPFTVVRDPRSRLLPTPAVARRVAATLRNQGCDQVIFGASAPLGLLAPHLRRAGAVRQVALTHGHEVWWAALPGTRRLLRRIGDEVDVMTYVSTYCRDRIAPALSRRAAARMAPLVPTVDTTRFRPGCGGEQVRDRLGIPAEALVVVCVARLVRRKGQDTLVRVWPEVRRRFPGTVLLLVGDGPDLRRLQRMVRRRGLGECVVLTGSVPWEEVPAHLDAGDVFAMPCRTRRWGLEVEAFGIVYLEAAACGLRVVGGRSGGAAEALARATPSQADGAGRRASGTAGTHSGAGSGDRRAVGDGGAGLGEDALDDPAEREDDHDDEGGDRGDEQAVLHGGGALLVGAVDEPLEQLVHGGSPKGCERGPGQGPVCPSLPGSLRLDPRNG
jgi:phosphatidylinositol alpha-1,6-mannosyltransferase